VERIRTTTHQWRQINDGFSWRLCSLETRKSWKLLSSRVLRGRDVVREHWGDSTLLFWVLGWSGYVAEGWARLQRRGRETSLSRRKLKCWEKRGRSGPVRSGVGPSGGHGLLLAAWSGQRAQGVVRYGEPLCGPAHKEGKWARPKKKISNLNFKPIQLVQAWFSSKQIFRKSKNLE
jgi:hypothetical protein